MSFSTVNKYFISAMRAKLGPLPEGKRQVRYLAEFQHQVKGRINIAYAAANDFEGLTLHYRNLLEVLHAYELEWITASIFFEPEADALINALLPEFAQIGQGGLQSGMIGAELFLGQCAPYDHSVLKGYLRSYFMQTIEASEQDWKEEDRGRNPMINLLEMYISSCIIEGEAKKTALGKVLFHFAKLWQLYYSQPFSTEKATVLLNRLLQGYGQLDKTELKIDLLTTLEEVENLLGSLPITAVEYPLDLKTQPGAYRLPHQTILGGGYWIKKNEFFEMLENDRTYFQDLDILPVSTLLEFCQTATVRNSGTYLKALEKRCAERSSPDFPELLQLAGQYQKLTDFDPPLRKILEKLMREHYIFF
jgi:hypothetical protein